MKRKRGKFSHHWEYRLFFKNKTILYTVDFQARNVLVPHSLSYWADFCHLILPFPPQRNLQSYQQFAEDTLPSSVFPFTRKCCLVRKYYYSQNEKKHHCKCNVSLCTNELLQQVFTWADNKSPEEHSPLSS